MAILDSESKSMIRAGLDKDMVLLDVKLVVLKNAVRENTEPSKIEPLCREIKGLFQRVFIATRLFTDSVVEEQAAGQKPDWRAYTEILDAVLARVEKISGIIKGFDVMDFDEEATEVILATTSN